MKHKHREIPLHSEAQAAMFFALASELKYEPDEVKERAKNHFKTSCFNDLKISDLMYLIDKMVKKQEEKVDRPLTEDKKEQKPRSSFIFSPMIIIESPEISLGQKRKAGRNIYVSPLDYMRISTLSKDRVLFAVTSLKTIYENDTRPNV